MTCNAEIGKRVRYSTPLGDGDVIVARTTKDPKIDPDETRVCAIKLAIMGYYIGLSQGADSTPRFFDSLTCQNCGEIVEATFIFPR